MKKDDLERLPAGMGEKDMLVRCPNCSEEYDITELWAIVDADGLLVSCPKCEDRLYEDDVAGFLERSQLEEV